MTLEQQDLESPNLAALPVRWDGRGRVRKVSTDSAEWDSARREWASARQSEVSTFRSDGQVAESARGVASVQFKYDDGGKLKRVVASKNGGAQTRFACTYDDRERLFRVAQEIDAPQPLETDPFGEVSFETYMDNNGFRIGGAMEIAILYDEMDRPLELSYVVAGGQLRCRVQRTWNSAGLLESETLLPDTPGDLPPAPGWLLSFVYDSQGRRIEFECSIRGGKKFRSTFLYDDHNNMVEVKAGDQQQRFEYRYDSQGNWIERETWTWSEPAAEYRPASIERRAIEYS